MGGAELHYHNPLGAVIPNGKGSLDIALGRTLDVCPLSPLLFAIAIEPLAEAI